MKAIIFATIFSALLFSNPSYAAKSSKEYCEKLSSIITRAMNDLEFIRNHGATDLEIKNQEDHINEMKEARKENCTEDA